MIYIGNDHNFKSIITDKIIFDKEVGYDYGLILKIHPYEYKKRVWIVCAGIGEYGTSGAAWFLSHKWKEFFKKSEIINNSLSRFKSKNFSAIIRVTPGKDESAIIVKMIIDDQKNLNDSKINKNNFISLGSEFGEAPSPSGSNCGFIIESSGHTNNLNLNGEPTSSIDKKK